MNKTVLLLALLRQTASHKATPLPALLYHKIMMTITILLLLSYYHDYYICYDASATDASSLAEFKVSG